jgi:hypothetical protein
VAARPKPKWGKFQPSNGSLLIGGKFPDLARHFPARLQYIPCFFAQGILAKTAAISECCNGQDTIKLPQLSEIPC